MYLLCIMSWINDIDKRKWHRTKTHIDYENKWSGQNEKKKNRTKPNRKKVYTLLAHFLFSWYFMSLSSIYLFLCVFFSFLFWLFVVFFSLFRFEIFHFSNWFLLKIGQKELYDFWILFLFVSLCCLLLLSFATFFFWFYIFLRLWLAFVLWTNKKKSKKHFSVVLPLYFNTVSFQSPTRNIKKKKNKEEFIFFSFSLRLFCSPIFCILVFCFHFYCIISVSLLINEDYVE